MRKAKGGIIINVASLASKKPVIILSHYVASKYAVLGFSRSLALLPTRSALFNVANCQKALHSYVAALRTFEQWQELWTIVGLKYPKLTPMLKETLTPPKRKALRIDGLTLVVYVTGDSPESAVFLEISGGTEAVELKSELQKHIES